MHIICKKETTLFRFMEEKGYSHKKIKNLLQYEKILVNGEVVKRDYPIFPNTKIEILSSYKPIGTIDILYEDKDIIVVNKPASLLTIATDKEKEKTLYHKVLTYLKAKNKNNYLFVVHRLDKDTSGVLLFAKNRKIKDAFQKNWNTLAKERIYVGLVYGTMKRKSGTVSQYLRENRDKMVYETKKEYGKLAITSYRVLKEYDHATFLSISIQTGRKNQIRVAFSSMGNPIVGDKKYGKKDSFSRLYLHALKLTIYHPFTHKEMTFETKIPEEFDKIGKSV